MTVLDKILDNKRREIGALKDRIGVDDLKRRIGDIPPPRDFLGALKSCPHVPIIAEIKRSSPSLGKIKEVTDVSAVARTYESAGAAAMSVLTDKDHFGGALDDLTEARNSVKIPALRKDFIIEPIQLYESRAAHADAILLIVAALEEGLLHELYHETRELGMTPLVEVHNEDELDIALRLKPDMVGVNNRNLATLDVDLQTCVRLRSKAPKQVLLVGESGIKTPEDISGLRRSGIDAFLIGTSLMLAADPAKALAELCGA